MKSYPVFAADSISFDAASPWSEAGANATVFRGTIVATQQEVALKRLRWGPDDRELGNELLDEAETWYPLKHDAILEFMGVLRVGEMIYLVTPFLENGTVLSYLKKNPDVDRIALVCDIATGLAYLHQQGIVHGDMKAGNVLVDSSGSARIADYGMRRFKGRSQSLAASEILRLRHMSPECLMASESVPPTKASDTYAFGMTIYEILSGQVPFYKTQELALLIQGICDGQRPMTEPTVSPTGQSYDLVWLVARRCWEASPGERISMEESASLLNRRTVSKKEVMALTPTSTPISSSWFSRSLTVASQILSTVTFGYSTRVYRSL